MQETRKATPTEYKGIAYRSKCEAMFARYLDLDLCEQASISEFLARRRGHDVTIPSSCGCFAYEPNTGIPGWNTDFLVVEHEVSWPEVWATKRIKLHWIEYKPSRPTITYIRKWAAKACEWYDANGRTVFDGDKFSIYYGNPYTYPDKAASVIAVYPNLSRSDDVESFLMIPERQQEEAEFDWLANVHDDLMAYRFDLADPEGR